MLTVPNSFNIKAGTVVKPRLTSEGIFYEFVDEDDFFDFDEEILRDLVDQEYQGQKLIEKFKARKKRNSSCNGQVSHASGAGPDPNQSGGSKTNWPIKFGLINEVF